MSKEEVAKRVEQSLDLFEQGQLIDMVAFGEDVRSLITQAAANKAAEEGEPTDAELAQEVLLEDLEDIANYWDGTMVEAMRGPLNVGQTLRERFAKLKFPAIAADRASRQVANKAAVETIDTPEFRELLAAFKNSCLGFDYNETVENLVAHINGRFATPPATTGASTVLTDERISEIATLTCNDEDYGGFHFTNSGRYSVLSFARAIEREVAAQAGQVAVPGWISVDDRLPELQKEVLICCGYLVLGYRTDDKHDPENHNGWVIDFDNGMASPITHWMPLPPSPAKESK